jgi:hypothetical protein
MPSAPLMLAQIPALLWILLRETDRRYADLIKKAAAEIPLGWRPTYPNLEMQRWDILLLM